MNQTTALHCFADFVLVIHTAFVAFVFFGLLLILIGGYRGWSWIRNPWFRGAHLAAIGVVVVQSWLGWECPLTTLEMNLRARAGDATYASGFIAHWLHALIFYEAPEWVFKIGYTLFGLAVAVSWFKYRPRSFRMR